MEAAEFGITEVSASDLQGHVEKLKEIDSMSGKSGFEVEFEVCTLLNNIAG